MNAEDTDRSTSPGGDRGATPIGRTDGDTGPMGSSHEHHDHEHHDHGAAEHWATALGRWAIPEHILEQAPESPWIHPVSSFTPTGDLHVDTPSRHRALEALAGITAPSVLDIGCGGGRAAFGLVPPAIEVIGVDHQAGMLEVFERMADERSVVSTTVLGDWPDVVGSTPMADVVVCHHVFYNVADLVPFVRALTGRARHRVVVELPQRHPLSNLSAAWRTFWGLERPEAPTADDALAVVRSTGVDARLEPFTQPTPVERPPITDTDVAHMRIRLCLTADRDEEVRRFMEANPAGPRDLATIWWDV
ncbi:MAG: class I SAM-dependent methyltransferase [Ilumatobacteraceae bacterium]